MKKPTKPRSRSDLHDRQFYRAEQEAWFAEAHAGDTPQTRDPAYRLAFRDTDFLLRDELRPVRFQLELLKPEMCSTRRGSARPWWCTALRASRRPRRSRRRSKAPRHCRTKSGWWSTAGRQFQVLRRGVQAGRLVSDMRSSRMASASSSSARAAGRRSWKRPTAARRRRRESIGLNIVLPHEQAPNPYVTPDCRSSSTISRCARCTSCCARARWRCSRRFRHARRIFRVLTLIQTGKMKPIPILLFGKEFWNRVINFDALAEEGVITRPTSSCSPGARPPRKAGPHSQILRLERGEAGR